MQRVSVVSSNIDSIGYDAPSQTLEVCFKNGSIYQYFDVPEQVYRGLMSADSPGRYLNQNIKGLYRYARV